MSFDMRFPMSAALCALTLATGSAMAAVSVPDVLERPALERLPSRTLSAVLLDVAEAGDHYVAVGEHGIILRSDDAGSTWHQVDVPVSVTLTSVSFADARHGWVAGHSGVALMTEDGGQHWQKRFDGDVAAQRVMAAVEAGTLPDVYRTEAERLAADGPDKPFLAVHFSDARHGVLLGAYGLIFSTDDGGESWAPMLSKIPNPGGLHFYAIQDTGERIYIVGEQGSAYVSDDRGVSFQALETPYQGTFFGVLAESDRVLAFGMRGNAYWSADGGQHWTRSRMEGENALTAGARLQDGRLMLVDDGGNLHLSDDGGATFARIAVDGLGPLTGVVQTEAGDLLLTSARGVNRLALSALETGTKP